MAADPNSKTTSALREPYRWFLAGVGVVLVGVGAVGAVVPGLPTTIFLILASVCFTKSCPWLEERLIRNRFFAPYLKYLDGHAMTPRAKLVAALTMWLFAGTSAALLAWRGMWAVSGVVVGLALIGTIAIALWRGIRRAPQTSAVESR